MNGKIKTVLLGLGNMGRNHLRVLGEDERFEVTAVVDPHHNAPLNASSIKLLDGLDKLSTIDFDCAVVATPTQTHYEIVKKLLQRRKHVLVEKPAASTYQQSVELQKLATENGVALAVGNIERCNPAVVQLKAVLDAGLIGTPVHCNAVRAGRFPVEVKEGNHVILDLAVHELDVLRMILGPIQIAHSVCHSTCLPGIYDTAEILLTSEHGISAAVHVNWLTPNKVRQLRVTGSDGVCVIDYIEQTCVVFGHNLRQRLIPGWDHAYIDETHNLCDKLVFAIPRQEPLKVQLTNFHNFLTAQPHILCSGDELSESVWLAEQSVAKSFAGFEPAVFQGLGQWKGRGESF